MTRVTSHANACAMMSIMLVTCAGNAALFDETFVGAVPSVQPDDGGVVVVVAALAATGYLSAWLGGARPGRAVLRLVLGGAVAMAVTYGIGALVGAAVG